MGELVQFPLELVQQERFVLADRYGLPAWLQLRAGGVRHRLLYVVLRGRTLVDVEAMCGRHGLPAGGEGRDCRSCRRRGWLPEAAAL